MSAPQTSAQAQTTTTTEAQAGVTDLLEAAIKATKQTERSRTEQLLSALINEALQGTVTWDKNVTKSITSGIEALDAAISKQLAAIMHNPKFQELEGTWRGLHYLVDRSETSTMLKLKVLNVSKRELFKDLDKAIEFDQSMMWKKVYESEFGSPGGEPYGAMIGNYEFTNHPEDVELLSKMSNVAAGAFCPFISAADPSLFGFEEWTELSKPRDLAKIFDTVEYTKWRSFRESEDSRFVTMVMPRVLSRLPYGPNTKSSGEKGDFQFQEVALDASGRDLPMTHDGYTWMNAAFVYGARLTDAFSRYGWCTAIRGFEGGGKVEDLPAHIFLSDDGDPDLKCPTEVGITDRRENELSGLGFLPLSHYKNRDYAVFFGGQTTQKPKKYDRPDATANAAISARLPYIMATSRIAHYLKVMARDWIGRFMEATDMEADLNRWIKNYVNSNPAADQENRARFPLADAKIKVEEIPGKPGSYNAVAWLRPWLQFEELTTSLRLVAKMPDKK